MLPGDLFEGVVASFSPAADAFALATPDGRLKTFNTGTGRLRSDLSAARENGLSDGHLVERHTSLAWVNVPKKSKGKKRDAEAALVAGTAAGDVKLYDTAMGSLRWRSASANDGGVAAVATTPDGDVFSAGADAQVTRLAASSGAVSGKHEISKHPISALAASADGGHLLVASSSVALHDATDDDLARTARFSGHTAPVRAAVVDPSGQYAFTAAVGERQVAVWKVAGPSSVGGGGGSSTGKKKGKSRPAVASLAMEAATVQLDACSSSGREDGAVAVVAVTERGEACVWECAAVGEDGGVKATLLARIRVGEGAAAGAASGSTEHVLAGKLLEVGPEEVVVLVARGSTALPVFERVVVARRPEGQAAVVQLEPTLGGGALLKAGKTPEANGVKGKAGKKGAAEATVLDPANLGGLVTRADVAGDAAAAAGPRKRPHEGASEEEEEEGGEDEDMEAGTSGEEEGGEEEETLGQRVAALEVAQRGAAGSRGAEEELPMDAAAAPTANSISVLLTQALRSGDKALLEKCLAVGNRGVIRATVRGLLPASAVALLTAAVSRLAARPSRSAQLTEWIQAVLLQHTGYLMSAPAAVKALGELSQAVEARLAVQGALQSLGGRLDVVLAQVEGGAAGGGVEDLMQPQVVYVESDSEDEPEAEGGVWGV